MKNTRKEFFILSVLLVFSSLGLRLSFTWGSQSYFFSLLAIFLPMVGVLFKTKKSVGVVAVYFFMRAVALRVGVPFTFGLPSLCSAANWSSHEREAKYAKVQRFLLNIILPLVCMIIFMVHPIGRVAWMYSFYWFIPVGLYFLKKQSVFTTSLQSSFIAHAVGSIFWLFFMPMSPECWVALIPIVAVERLLFALAGVAVYRAIKRVMEFSWILRSQPVQDGR